MLMPSSRMAKFIRKDVERHMELKYGSSEWSGKGVQLRGLRGELEQREWRPSWVEIVPVDCFLWVRYVDRLENSGGETVQCVLRMRSILG